MRGRGSTSRLVRATERLERHTLAVGVVVAVIAAIAAVVSTIAINGIPFSHPYEVSVIVPPEAPIVRAGDEVRIAGRRAGEVRGVEVSSEGGDEEGEPGRELELELDDATVAADATATVRLRGLAGAVYVELDPGEEEALPSGAVIGREATATGTQLTDVIEAFDAETRESLSRTLSVTGAGLAGRGEDINRALGDLEPVLRNGKRLLDGVTRDPGPTVLAGMIGDAGATAAGLGGDGHALAGTLAGAAPVSEAVARQREALGATLEAAPGTLGELDRTLPAALPLFDELDRAAVELTPATEALERALPSLNSLLARDQDVDAIARVGVDAQPVVEQADPVLAGLLPTAQTLGPLARSGEPLAAYVGQYPEDVLAGPTGFTTWGDFPSPEGQAPGARAIRFTPILTCAPGRNPYPAPNAASQDREPCFG